LKTSHSGEVVSIEYGATETQGFCAFSFRERKQ